MIKTVEAVMPIGYNIKVRQSHFLEDGTPIWILDYTEYHTEEGYKKSYSDSKEIFQKAEFPMKFNDDDKSASYEMQGPKYQIVNVLAGEFLAISSIGEMALKDLLATLTNALVQSGFKIPK